MVYIGIGLVVGLGLASGLGIWLGLGRVVRIRQAIYWHGVKWEFSSVQFSSMRYLRKQAKWPLFPAIL